MQSYLEKNIKIFLTSEGVSFYHSESDSLFIDLSTVNSENTLLGIVSDEGTHSLSDNIEDGKDNDVNISNRTEKIVEEKGINKIDLSNIDLSDNNSISNSITKDEREDKGYVGSGFVKADKIEYVRCEDAKLGCTLGTVMKAIVEVLF